MSEDELRDAVVAWAKAKRAFKLAQDRSYDAYRKVVAAEAELTRLTGTPS